MKKRELRSLQLHKTQITKLANLSNIKGGRSINIATITINCTATRTDSITVANNTDCMTTETTKTVPTELDM